MSLKLKAEKNQIKSAGSSASSTSSSSSHAVVAADVGGNSGGGGGGGGVAGRDISRDLDSEGDGDGYSGTFRWKKTRVGFILHRYNKSAKLPHHYTITSSIYLSGSLILAIWPCYF